MLDDISHDVIKFSYAPGSYRNLISQHTRYLDFCTSFRLTPFPVSQWQLIRFMVFLSFTFISPDAVFNYATGICIIQELSGYDRVVKGILYRSAKRGIRKKMQHMVRRAAPVTEQILLQIAEQVDPTDTTQVVIWTAMLFAFNMMLRKSNYVPELKEHEPTKQLSRRDVRYFQGAMLVHVKWSKTLQCGDRVVPFPMMANKKSVLCPVRWFLYMCKLVPAMPYHNAFSIIEKGRVVPVTYAQMLTQFRAWLNICKYDEKRFALHSLRRGAATTAFEKNLSDLQIKRLGDWASDAYRTYIEIDLEERLNNWKLFSR